MISQRLDLRIVHWNKDKTTIVYVPTIVYVLCLIASVVSDTF